MYTPVKKKGQRYPNHPEDNRLIKCYCSDWCPYTVIGKFVPYKKPEKHRNYVALSRFMVFDNHTKSLVSAKEDWLNCDRWEYINETDE